MSDARSAIGIDRLPWLADEPQPRSRTRRTLPIASAGAAAVVLVAGVSYWMGAKSVDAADHGRRDPPSSTTMALPQPKPAAPTEEVVGSSAADDLDVEVRRAPAPEVQPSPQPQVRIPEPPVVRPKRSTKPADARKASTAVPVQRPAAPPAVRSLPPSNVSGGYGRTVQIGAFGSRQQAKLGWRRMTRTYPAVGHLQAVVIPARNSRGRLFYRFQIATTSQAHSEVLCQRMQRIHFSCAVVGLPWKAKVER